MEAVKRGSSVIGVRTPTCVILAVERRATPLLQDPRPIRKILTLDDHVQCAFAGLTADARVLLNLARQECQSYRLTCEDAPSVEYVARYVARRQQEYTQRGGVRPFGISTMMGGFDGDKACLMQTDPAGTFSEWKANAVGGKNAKVMREFLEKGWTENMSEADGVKVRERSERAFEEDEKYIRATTKLTLYFNSLARCSWRSRLCSKWSTAEPRTWKSSVLGRTGRLA